MQRMLVWIGLAALLIGGCGPSATKDKSASESTPTIKKGGNGTDSTNGKPEPAEPTGQITQAELDTIPENLKHDGFRYYGFSSLKPIKYRVTVTGVDPMEGEQVAKLKEIKDGEAIMEQEGTGGLAQVGTQILTIKPDGVYARGMSRGKIEGSPLQLPSQLTIGKTWTSKQKVEMDDGRKFETNQTAKVVREEKVKVPAGEFDAILVSAKGPAKIGETEGTMSIETWYVKDVGPVKVVFTQTPKGSSDSQVSTFEMIP